MHHGRDTVNTVNTFGATVGRLVGHAEVFFFFCNNLLICHIHFVFYHFGKHQKIKVIYLDALRVFN